MTVRAQLPQGITEITHKGVKYKANNAGAVTVPEDVIASILSLGGTILPSAVTTANRPKNADVGVMIFDTTLNKPIWRGNAGWVDATGANA